ncbi:MAG: oligoribonuclease, partial [Gammaproteobacteria bacterium]
AMDEWNQTHHGQSGLIDRVRASAVDEAEAERQTLNFLRQWVPDRCSPMCGNSIGQDRRFLYRSMKKLEAFFHYRNLDVSTLKELAARWAPEIKEGFTKKEAHRALDDIIESIEELRYYRDNFLKL